MRSSLGVILVVVGLIGMAVGGGMAVKELVGLYQSTVDRPMEDVAGGTQGVSDRMIHGAIIGGIGAVPFVIGSVILKVQVARRLARSLSKK